MAERLGLSMRVVHAEGYVEPRDALAQDWGRYLQAVLPAQLWMPIPNLGEASAAHADRWDLDGLILTGGDDLERDPLRDLSERRLLERAMQLEQPVLGVCRGMQLIQSFLGGTLEPVNASRHVGCTHLVRRHEPALHSLEVPAIVNSFHRWGIRVAASELVPFAWDEEGHVEGFLHTRLPIVGVMWHPERTWPPDEFDVALLRHLFDGTLLAQRSTEKPTEDRA